MFSKFKHSLKKAFIPPDDNAAFAAPEGYVRPKVYFDISIGQQAVGRIIMGAVSSSIAADDRTVYRCHSQDLRKLSAVVYEYG